jgi:hypothetical protein
MINKRMYGVNCRSPWEFYEAEVCCIPTDTIGRDSISVETVNCCPQRKLDLNRDDSIRLFQIVLRDFLVRESQTVV